MGSWEGRTNPRWRLAGTVVLLVLAASISLLAIQQCQAHAAHASGRHGGTVVVSKSSSGEDAQGIPSTEEAAVTASGPVSASAATQTASASDSAAPERATPDSSAAGTTVTFVVPPMTFVRLNGDGHPVAASTNTGLPPRPTDLFVVDDGGARVPADAAVVAAVLAHHTHQSWATPDAWHAL